MRIALILLAAVCLWADKGKPLLFTAQAPSATVMVDGASVRAGRRVLLVHVSKVRNPRGTSLSFEVSARPRVRQAPMPLGGFALYPSDQPGVFYLPLPATIERSARGAGRFGVELRMEATDAEGLEVEVSRVELVRPPQAPPTKK